MRTTTTYLLRCFVAALLLTTGLPSVEASRYAEVKPNRLTMAQRAPLRVTVDITFPRSVTNVGEAVQYALQNSGYTLSRFAGDAESQVLFALPLPDVHREFKQTELAALLLALGQPGYDLVVDDSRRWIAYESVSNRRTAP